MRAIWVLVVAVAGIGCESAAEKAHRAEMAQLDSLASEVMASRRRTEERLLAAEPISVSQPRWELDSAPATSDYVLTIRALDSTNASGIVIRCGTPYGAVAALHLEGARSNPAPELRIGNSRPPVLSMPDGSWFVPMAVPDSAFISALDSATISFTTIAGANTELRLSTLGKVAEIPTRYIAFCKPRA